MQQKFEKAIVEQCAPTLAGIKPASLFRVSGKDLAALRQTAGEWDRLLSPLGLRVLVLKECPQTNAGMIYLYRESWLKRILEDRQHRRFLRSLGYTLRSLEDVFSQLSWRFCLEREYPHEIGVFLGYPFADVIGFIENRGRNFTCCGYWKSYGDPEAAEQCFARYRSCTAQYKQLYGSGTPIIQLVVAA